MALNTKHESFNRKSDIFELTGQILPESLVYRPLDQRHVDCKDCKEAYFEGNPEMRSSSGHR